LPARVSADAASLAAQHPVAGAEPLVRGRGRTHVKGTDQQPARAGGHAMKVSIIGGTGFIGSHLVEALVERGHMPRLLVRRGSEGKVAQRDRCEVVTGDIGDRTALAACLDGADALVYLIGILREFPSRG